MEGDEDDMFEPIPANESIFIEKLNQQEKDLITFQESQNQIQNSLNDLKLASFNITQQSTPTEIKNTLQIITDELQRLLADSMINSEMINNIRMEHDKLEKEFDEFQKKIQAD